MKEAHHFPQSRIGALITLHTMDKPGHVGVAVHKHGHDFVPGQMPTEACPDKECIMALIILTPEQARWIADTAEEADEWSEHPPAGVVRD